MQRIEQFEADIIANHGKIGSFRIALSQLPPIITRDTPLALDGSFSFDEWYGIAPEPEVRDYHCEEWCAWISGTGQTICKSPGHAIEVGLHDKCGAGRMRFKYQGPPMTIYICYGLEFRGDIAYHGCWGWMPVDMPACWEREDFNVDIPQDRWWTIPPDVPRRTYSTAKWFASEPTTDESKFISEVPWDQDKDCYKVI